MRKNRPQSRIFISTVLLTSLLSLSSISHAQDTVSESPAPSQPSSLPSIGSSTPSKNSWEGARIEINEIKRSTESNYTSLTWTLYNESNRTISLNEFGSKTYFYHSGSSGSGLVIFDETKGIRYNTYIDSENDCLCAGSDHSPGKFRLQTKPGSHTTYWASYQLSEDTEKVTIEIPGFLPVKDVPVS